MRKEWITGIALAFAATSAFAQADDTAMTFSQADGDGNGSVSKDEFYGTVSDQGTYSDWDTNSDGLVDETEWNELGVDYDYDTWDANSDGYLDSGEFYDGYYTTYDANGDGEWNNGEWDDFGNAGLFDF